MAEDTIDLDGRRGMAAQKAARMRRQLAAANADRDRAAPQARQEELENLLLAAPATGWLKPWPRPVIF